MKLFSSLGGCGYKGSSAEKTLVTITEVQTLKQISINVKSETAGGYSLANIKLEYTWMNQDVYFWPNFDVGWYIGHEVIPSRSVMRSYLCKHFICIELMETLLDYDPLSWFCNCQSVKFCPNCTATCKSHSVLLSSGQVLSCLRQIIHL